PPRDAVTVVGPVAAQSAIEWFKSETGIRTLNRMRELGISPSGSHQAQSSSIFSGKTIVLTGALEKMTRSDAQDRIRRLGGNVTSIVSRKPDLVIAGPGAGSKLDDAKQLGIQIIDEDELLRLLAGNKQ